MGKAAAKKETTTTAEAEIQRTLDTFNVKQQFFMSALNMSWQLALTVIIPVVAGVKLDEKFDSSPSLTLTGFFLAAAAAYLVVWNTAKGVNQIQSGDDKSGLKALKRRRRVK